MNTRGHNENAMRLGILADDAKQALNRVAKGEADALEGWLAYGAALNEGRSLFPGDREFGQWKAENVLSQLGSAQVKADEEIAAMWAAANADQFTEARAAGNARTVRGIHAKWKEIEAEREARARAEAEVLARKQAAEEAAREAEQKAADEAAARQAAKKAKTEAEREEAKAKLADAINARKDAEAAAAEAKAEPIAGEPEPIPDPYGYAKLTEDALLDLANGLRADLDDAKKRIAKQRSEIADLKAQIKGFTGDHAEVVRRQAKQIEHMKSEMFRANDAARIKTVAARKAQDEVKALRKQLGMQEIDL